MISFLIVHYHRETYLNNLLFLLTPQLKKGDEIIVLDNGSDQSILSVPNNVLLIRSSSNKGVVDSRKRLIKESKNEYICFLDDDCEVNSNFRYFFFF